MIASSAVSEKRFQSQVIELARLSSWRTYTHAFDSRRSIAGFPDLVMVRLWGSGDWLQIEEALTRPRIRGAA